MENNLTNTFNFKGNNVFTIKINDKVWFWGNQIAILLKYKHPGNTINTLIKDKHVKTLKQSAFPNLGKATGLWNDNDHAPKKMIDVSGVFSLVLRSTLPAAEDFQDWVTDDVLPEIQKTGSYNGNQNQLPQTPQEVTKALLNNLNANNEDIQTLKHDVSGLKDNMRITGTQEKALLDVHHESAFKALGGQESNAYLDKKVRDKTFRAEWHEFKQMFHLPRYNEIFKDVAANDRITF